MVGTAFWWTKEEAERDAAETGKTITPIGPMSGIAPAEQSLGTPVGEVVAFGKGLHEIAWAAGRIPKLGSKLYTHADPGEVERLKCKVAGYALTLRELRKEHATEIDTLRAQLAGQGGPQGRSEPGKLTCGRCQEEFTLKQRTDCDGCCWKCGAELNLEDYLEELLGEVEQQRENHRKHAARLIDERGQLRAQLVERDALLESAAEGASILRSLIENIEAKGNYSPESTASFLQQALHCVSPALSPCASAEPSAPKCVPDKPSRCTSCDNCQGFNTGHDSTQQKPYSIRCDNCHKEARAADHTGLARAWNALNQGE